MKQHGEVALIGAADPVGDLGNGQVGLAQQRLGAFDPALDQVLMRGNPSGPLEHPGKMTGAHRNRAGNFGKRHTKVSGVSVRFPSSVKLARRKSYTDPIYLLRGGKQVHVIGH